MNILKGNASIGIILLKLVGFFGVILGTASHFLTWATIEAGDKKVLLNGLEGIGFIGIRILVIYLILLALDSVYVILMGILFLPYMIEQVIGLHLLRYMPLSTTKLTPALYLFLPLAAFMLLIG
jgi:lipid-A-disaccharide synthase-like uncharacterized protein